MANGSILLTAFNVSSTRSLGMCFPCVVGSNLVTPVRDLASWIGEHGSAGPGLVADATVFLRWNPRFEALIVE